MAFETILFADDTELIRKLMCPFLRTQGYEVIEAADGAEAIAAATHHPCPIDLLISDVEMPGLDGPALAGRLARRRPEMKVLFISGYPDCDLGPGVALLRKPFAPQSLVRKVTEIRGDSRRAVGSEGSQQGSGVIAC